MDPKVAWWVWRCPFHSSFGSCARRCARRNARAYRVARRALPLGYRSALHWPSRRQPLVSRACSQVRLRASQARLAAKKGHRYEQVSTPRLQPAPLSLRTDPWSLVRGHEAYPRCDAPTTKSAPPAYVSAASPELPTRGRRFATQGQATSAFPGRGPMYSIPRIIPARNCFFNSRVSVSARMRMSKVRVLCRGWSVKPRAWPWSIDDD